MVITLLQFLQRGLDKILNVYINRGVISNYNYGLKRHEFIFKIV